MEAVPAGHAHRESASLREVIAVMRLHRKAAIRLLRTCAESRAARPRSGRPRLYGSAVATTAALVWEAAGYMAATAEVRSKAKSRSDS